MKHSTCPVCGDETAREVVQSAHMDFEGNQIQYKSRATLCGACGTEFVTLKQSQLNKRAVIRAKSDHLDLPSREALREWRRRWGLTQQAAGDLLGVGPVAFSKYENAALLPSAPTARLLDAVMNSDQVVRKLAEKHDIEVQFFKGATSRSATRSIKQITDFLVTTINAGPSSSTVKVTGHSDIESVFHALASPEATSLNIRQTNPDIYHEWTPSLPGQIMSSYSAKHGETNVSYH